MAKSKIITGLCPYSKKRYSMSVDYDTYFNHEDKKDHDIKLGFKCSLISECVYRDNDNECPVFLKIPE